MLKDIEKALEVLEHGGTIIYPTDTIWGIGCDATNELAVQKIYDLKKRADTKSMLILVEKIERINDYVEIIPEIARQIIEVANKPLSIVFPNAQNLAKNLINQDGSIGIRVVKDEFCCQLISRFNKPIVSTSANESGRPAPKRFSEINKNLLSKIDYTVKWRQNENSEAIPSSIIKCGIKGEIEIIRE